MPLSHSGKTQTFFRYDHRHQGPLPRAGFCYTIAMKMAEYLKTNPRQDHRSKYGNLKTEYNGTVFHSKKEAEYAKTLDWMKKITTPSDRVLRYDMQVPFQIIMNGIKIAKYIADFKVFYADGSEEIIDVKGVRTNIYVLKKKLVEAQYGVKIIEV